MRSQEGDMSSPAELSQDYIPWALELVAIAALAAMLLASWKQRRQRRLAVPAARLLELTDNLRDIQEQLTEAYGLIEKSILGQVEAIDSLQDRISSLKEKQTATELTPEQEKAITALFYRPRTAVEVLSSRDFWIGRVLPGVLFFSLGMLVQMWRSR
jgi:hypothetical protein